MSKNAPLYIAVQEIDIYIRFSTREWTYMQISMSKSILRIKRNAHWCIAMITSLDKSCGHDSSKEQFNSQSSAQLFSQKTHPEPRYGQIWEIPLTQIWMSRQNLKVVKLLLMVGLWNMNKKAESDCTDRKVMLWLTAFQRQVIAGLLDQGMLPWVRANGLRCHLHPATPLPNCWLETIAYQPHSGRPWVTTIL